MTDPSIDTAEIASVPIDATKRNDPRAKVTGRGIGIGVLVAVFAIVGAWASIKARKTQLGETTRFWGPETIMALQLGERIEIRPRGVSDFEPVDLTSTPGLGHLRRALLDERHYDWTTETASPVLEMCANPGDTEADQLGKDGPFAGKNTPTCLQLRITDPTGKRFEPVEIDLALVGGWAGPSDGSRRVRTTEWVRPKLYNWFATIMNVQQTRYDLRE
ncbi:MAG: hypothetical protein WBD31_14005 [Rubripirellula sp.]